MPCLFWIRSYPFVLYVFVLFCLFFCFSVLFWSCIVLCLFCSCVFRSCIVLCHVVFLCCVVVVVILGVFVSSIPDSCLSLALSLCLSLFLPCLCQGIFAAWGGLWLPGILYGFVEIA